MIIEKSTSGYMYLETVIKYFSIDYELICDYDFTMYAGSADTSILENLREVSPDLVDSYDKDTNLQVILKKTDELVKKNYPFLREKISVCSVGPFPVLFRTGDELKFEEYLSFYGNRFIIFGNCNNEATQIAHNIMGDFCDDKIFNIILTNSSDGAQIATLTNFQFINIKNLRLINLNETLVNTRFKLKDDRIVQELPGTAAAAAAKWECTVCTFKNGAHAIECEVCSTPKPAAAAKWECAVCTFKNDIHVIECEVCSTPKPAIGYLYNKSQSDMSASLHMYAENYKKLTTHVIVYKDPVVVEE
jgi:hypothetical protein